MSFADHKDSAVCTATRAVLSTALSEGRGAWSAGGLHCMAQAVPLRVVAKATLPLGATSVVFKLPGFGS